MLWHGQSICTLIAGNPSPPWRVFYLAGSLTKNPEQEDSPWSTWYKFFELVSLPLGSWFGNLPNRKSPRGGGVPVINFMGPLYKGKLDTGWVFATLWHCDMGTLYGISRNALHRVTLWGHLIHSMRAPYLCSLYITSHKHWATQYTQCISRHIHM